MLEGWVRPAFQRICVDRFCPFLSRFSVSPQCLSLAAGISGILFTAFLYYQHMHIASLCLLISGYLDVFDGAYARFLGAASPQGAVLDITMDRCVESAVLWGLFLVNPSQRGGLIVLMFSAILICVTTFLVVGVFTENSSHKSFHYSPGLMERPEAFIFFLCMVYFPTYFEMLALLFSFLVFLTAGVRLYQFMRVQ